jgi:hypothetical protein
MPDINDLTRVVREKIVICTCGCWFWAASTDTSGYGKFKLRGTTLIAHRYVWEHFHGPIEADLTVDHLNCPTRRCVNPDHMQLITRSENSRRANATKHHGLKYDELGDQTATRACDRCQNRRGTLGQFSGGTYDNETRVRGIDNPASKLTEDQVRMIFADTQSSIRALSARFEVDRHTIADIRNGVTWKHITQSHSPNE